GQRGEVEMPHERLLLERQLVEAVGVQLHDRGIVDLLEQVRPRRRYIGRSTFCPWLGISTFHPSSFVMRTLSASCATTSPCTRYVFFGARGNVRSQRTISPASACDD